MEGNSRVVKRKTNSRVANRNEIVLLPRWKAIVAGRSGRQWSSCRVSGNSCVAKRNEIITLLIEGNSRVVKRKTNSRVANRNEIIALPSGRHQSRCEAEDNSHIAKQKTVIVLAD